MSQTIRAEHFTYLLNAFLDETFEQVHGIFLDRGTSLFETLADISAEEASQATSGRCATLAAQVNHVRFYLDVIEKSMLGTLTEPADWQSSWQVGAVASEEWSALNSELKASYGRVRAIVAGLDSWDDADRLGDALAIIVHTAHHLGEIRQMLCAIRR